jgi:hypothetical protein
VLETWQAVPLRAPSVAAYRVRFFGLHPTPVAKESKSAPTLFTATDGKPINIATTFAKDRLLSAGG